MPTCAECVNAELQCPPIIRCKIHGDFKYLDTPSCDDYKSIEDEKSEKS